MPTEPQQSADVVELDAAIGAPVVGGALFKHFAR